MVRVVTQGNRWGRTLRIDLLRHAEGETIAIRSLLGAETTVCLPDGGWATALRGH